MRIIRTFPDDPLFREVDEYVADKIAKTNERFVVCHTGPGSLYICSRLPYDHDIFLFLY